MTEAEWLRLRTPGRMIDSVHANEARKTRLLACACARQVWDLMPDDRVRAYVELVERSLDERVKAAALSAARQRARKVEADYLRQRDFAAEWFAVCAALNVGKLHLRAVLREASGYAMEAREFADRGPGWQGRRSRVRAEQAGYLRDIFGNPFRPVAFAPEWRTDTAVALARQMYESRDFSAMPILADALQDSGCDNPGVLAHCRGPGPHVRGCWVIDAVLDKP